MKVPIQIIGIATLIFWVFLFAFLASAAYSMKDLRFDIGDPQFTTTPSQDFIFSLPIYIDNRGYSSLKDFYIATEFLDVEGSLISNASTFVPVIPHGESITILHNVTLSLDALLEKGEQYLFNDSDLTISVSAGLNFAELLPTKLTANFTYPWGAPFYNFMSGQPEYAFFNATHVRVTVPVSFENHAQFDLAGNIRIELYDDANTFLGESQTAFAVPSHSPYNGYFEFYVPLSMASVSGSTRGHVDVYFSTSLFEYGPLVIPYG